MSRRARTRRGGFLSLSGDATKALAEVNKSVDDIVREHLTPNELDKLCHIWGVVSTGGRTHDADKVLKLMHSQPSFVNHMAMLALGTKGIGLAAHELHKVKDPWLYHSTKDKGLHEQMATFHNVNQNVLYTGPLTYGLRYLYGKYKDSSKSTKTIGLLLSAIERLKRSSARKSGRATRR